MKFTSVIVSALATVASAAPAKSVEDRSSSSIDLSQLNNLQSFGSVDIQYLASINTLDVQLLQTLGESQNLNINSFNSLFQGNDFSLSSILQLQQLQTILALGQTGVFQNFDLSSINLEQQLLQFGLLQNSFSQFSLSSLVDQSLVPQIQTIAQSFVTVISE